MSTLSDIITRSFRESQILDINRPPSDAQIAEALPILNGIISRHIRPAVQTIWLGNVAAVREQRGITLKNFTPFMDNRAVPQNCYVNLLSDAARTLLLPPSPGDGARLTFIDVLGSLASFPLTLNGNGNNILGNPVLVLSTSLENTSIMFRRDLAEWIRVSPLTQLQSIPFPDEFDDMFVIELAMRLNPRYGKEISPITSEIYQSIRSRHTGRYLSENSSADPDILWDSSLATNSDTGAYY